MIGNRSGSEITPPINPEKSRFAKIFGIIKEILRSALDNLKTIADNHPKNLD